MVECCTRKGLHWKECLFHDCIEIVIDMHWSRHWYTLINNALNPSTIDGNTTITIQPNIMYVQIIKV